MRIKYHTTEDDFVAFNVFYLRHSSHVRRTEIIAGVIVLGLLLILMLPPVIYFHDWTYAFIGVVIFGGLALRILTGKSGRARHVARKIFKEGKNKNFLGIHELEIDDYGILTKDEYSEGKIAWAGIERIGSTPDYTFIFTGANTAIPLPKAQVIEGNYEAFVAELKSRFAKITAVAPMSPDNAKKAIIVDYKPASGEDKRAGRHSGYGITSFLMALAAIAVVFLTLVSAVIITIVVGETVEKGDPSFVIFGVGFVFAWGMAFVGAGFGIAGLLTKNRKKPFAVIGLILNLLMFLSVVVLMVLT